MWGKGNRLGNFLSVLTEERAFIITLLILSMLSSSLENNIKNQRHQFQTKVHIVKAMVFQVVMYICESRIIKEAER